MKKLFTRLVALALLVVAGSSSGALAQSTANYAFSTNTTSSLTQDANGNTLNMTVAGGATQSVAAGSDDVPSTVTNIGFTFYFMGNAYTQFSVNSNGGFMLGGTVISGSQYTTSGGSSTSPRFSALASDGATASAADGGGVFTRVVGSAPNRCLVTQWISYNYYSGNTTGLDTFQLRLYETTGAVEMVFGSMPAGTAPYSSGFQTGFSSGSAANTLASVAYATNTVSTSAWTSNIATAGTNITSIHSPNPTQRRMYRFMPPQTPPADPTTLTFTAITANTITPNWIDNSTTEAAFLVIRATDAAFTQNVVISSVATTTSAGTGQAYSLAQSGLAAGTTYYYKIQSIAEAVPSTGLTGNQATAAAITYYWVGASGSTWSTAANWNTAADGTGSSRGTVLTSDVLIVDGAGSTPGSGGTMSISVDQTSPFSIGQLQVTSNTQLSLAASNTTTRVITITGAPGDDLSVGSGSSLTLNNTTNAVAFAFSGAGNTGNIAGTVNIGGSSSNQITTTGGTGTLVTVANGGFFRVNQWTGVSTTFTTTVRPSASAATFAVANGGTFSIDSLGSSTLATPLATWGASSNYNIAGATTTTSTPSNTGQSYGNVTWNCPAAASTSIVPLFGSATTAGVGVLGIQGDLNVTNAGAGTLRLSTTTATIAIGGNVTVSAGTNTTQGAFQGSSSTSTINIAGNLNVNGGSFSPSSSTGSVNVSGNMTIASGATYYTSSGIAGTNNAVLSFRGTTLTNNGSIVSTNSTTTAAGTLGFFSPTNAAQTFTGSGTFTNPIGSFGVQTTGGLTMSGLSASVVPVMRINAFAGTITGAGKFTLGANNLATAIQYGNAAGGAALGVASLNAAPTFNLGTGLLTVIYGVETSARTTGVEIPGSRAVGAVSIGNTLGTTLSGGNLSALTFVFGTGAGKFITSSSNLLTVTGTAAASISGQTNTAYVDGPLARSLAASQATGSTFIFPIGKGSQFKPLSLVNPTTNSGGRLTIRAEVFNASTGGTPTGLLGTLNSNRYWATSIDSGAGNFTNTQIRLTDTGGVGFADAIGSSSTLTGTYNMIAGTSATVTANDITTNASFPLTSIGNFYVLGQRAAPVLAAPGITPSGNQCTNVARTVTVVVTPGASATSTVILTYQVNGGTATNVSMTNTTGNGGLSADTWSGVIPTVTPSNGTVTWSVAATDGNSLTRSVTGTSYTDEPTNGTTAAAVATPASVCTGSNDTLMLNLSKAGTATLGAGATTYIYTPASLFYYYPGISSQYLVKASELTALGLSQGNLTSLGISLGAGTSTTATYQGFTISVASAGSLANLSSGLYTGSSFSTVYGPSAVSLATGTTDYTYTFATPFYWDGTSNIVIQICRSQNSTTTVTSNYAATDLTSYVSNAYYYTYNAETQPVVCGGGTASGYYATSSSRPKFVFGGNKAPVPTAYSWTTGGSTVGTTNPLVLAIAASATYTGTATIGGCPLAASIAVTALPVPTTPTGTNSTQCGSQIPTASVTSTSGLSGSTFRWYTVATGGTALAGETGSSLANTTVSSTTTYYVSERSAAGCESPRRAVTVTVNTPPVLTINGTNQTLCSGVVGTMTVTSNVGDYDSYVWSPTTNLYTDAAATVPYTTGTNASTVYVKSTTAGTIAYTLNASDATSACSNIKRDTITYQPSYTVAASATRTSVCAGDTTSVRLDVGGAPTSGYCSPTMTGTIDVYFTGFSTTGGLTNISNPTNAKSPNGYGNFTTGNTVTQVPGSTISFSASLGGASISGGVGVAIWVDWNRNGVFDATERVFNTTTYVSVTQTGTITVPANASFGQTRMRVLQDYNLTNPSDPCSPTGTASGEVEDYTFNVSPVVTAYSWSNGATTVGTTSPLTVTVGSTATYTGTATIAGCPNSAGVAITARPLPTTPTANSSSHCGVQTPFASVTSTSGVGSPTFRWYLQATGGTAIAGQTGSTLVNYPLGTTTTFYVSELGANGCESPRATVTETVTPAPALAVTQTAITICGVGSIGTLSASTATVGNFPTFVWSPTTGLYSDASATVPYTAGSNVSTVYVKAAAAGRTIYTLTASDANTGCVNTALDTATTFTSYPASVTATQPGICTGGVDTLTFNYGNATVPSGYCVPPANNTINYYTVDTFYTTGGSTNVSNIGSGYSTNGYGDFTTSGTVSQEPGGTVSFRASNPFYSMGWAIWVDWNQDGVYDTSERAFRTTATATFAQGSFTVPTNALIGKTRMRVMANPGATLPNDPCVYTFGYGEVEEYTFLVGPTPTAYSWSNGATVVGTSNPLVQTVNATTTYTVTATGNGGCPYVVSSTITANPVPTTPTGTNSTQCGTQTPTASVTSTSGLSGSTYRWYMFAAGGVPIAGQTGATLSSYNVSATTTFYVSEVSASGCESPRVAVTVTVNTAPALTLNSSTLSVCNGTNGTISVTSNLNSFDTYTWSPTTNLYLDAAGTTPYSSGITTATTVYVVSATPGTTIYTLTAQNSATSCANTAVDTVTIQPAYTATVAAGRTTVCAGDTTRLGLLLSGAGGGTMPTGYCTPTTTGATTYNITNFTTTGGTTNINYTSSATTVYEDFSGVASATAAPGTTLNYTMTVAGGSTYGPGIWIDLNRDGDFADAGEQVLVNTSGTYISSPVTGSFTIPTGTAEGLTRMRIIAAFVPATPTDPCTNTSTGQYEDYAFIVGPTPGSIAWSNGATTVGTTNPYTATVAATTTYTGTATLNGCTYSNNVTVTANPVPTTPTANNSTQCGAQTPTASVTSTSGLSGSTYRWFTVATGGTAIAGQTGASLVGYPVSATTTFYVSEVSASGCAGPRVAVTVTVTAAPTLATTSGATTVSACNGGIGTLSVSAATVGNFTNYVWTPTTGLFTDAAATVPYTTGTNASTVYFSSTTAGTTTYTVTATNGGGCQNTATAIGQILPVVAVTVSPTVVCVSGTPTATLVTGSTFTGAGATIAWATSPDSVTFTTQAGTGVTYTPGAAITSTTYYRATVTLSGNTCGVAAAGVPVYNPTVSSPVPATRCGAGTLTLSATGSAGSTLNWFAASTGGTALATGASFTTPVISATTTYYVSAVQSTCSSSPRTAIVATVTTSPAIAVDRRKVVVCNNDTAVLSVSAATVGNYTNYVWTPTTGLFTDAAATVPYTTGTNASTVYVKNATAGQTVYTVNGTDASNCSAVVNDTAIVLPAVAVTVSPTSGCLTTTPTATLTNGATFTTNGATVAWAASPDSVTFTTISGATGITYTPTVAITHDTFYQATVSNGARVCGMAAAKVSINNPSITSSTGATRCGPGILTLTATGTAGATLNWYTTQTGGTALTSGTSFTTPLLSATTTYYVGAASGPGVFSGLGRTATPGTTSGYSSERGIAVTITQGGTLNTAQVYVGAAGAYTYNYRLSNTSNTTITSTTITGTAAAPGFVTATLNWTLTPGNYFFNMGASSNTYGADLTGADYTNSAWNNFGSAGIITSGLNITPTLNSATYAGGFYNMQYTAGCEGPRTAVTATITTPSALAVDRPVVTVCNNDTAALSVSAATAANYTTFVWSPTTNLYTDAAATTPYTVSDNVSTVYAKSSTAGTTVYTVTATDVNGCTNTANDTLKVLPVVAITATPTALCLSGTPVLKLTSGSTFTNAGATIAWATSPDSATFTPVSGATGVTYTPASAISSNAFYQATVTSSAGRACGTAGVQVAVNNPSVATTTGASRCGTGTVTLTATGSTGTTLNWYSAATGGTALASGTSFTTPSIATSTNYYVSAASAPVQQTSVRTAPTTLSGVATVNAGLVFTASSAFTLNSVDVYNAATTAGSMTLQLQNSAGTVLQTSSSLTVPAGTGTLATTNPYRANVNWFVPAGTGYRLVLSSVSGSLAQEANLGGYPYAIGTVGSITGGYIGGNSATYSYFYNWRVSSVCESPRTAVAATINASPSVTTSPSAQTVCNNGIATLSVSATTLANSGYTTFVWSPIANLYTDAAATTPYTTGTNATTVYAKAATANTYTYAVTGSGGGAGCQSSGSATVRVLPAATVTVSPTSVCGTGTPTATLVNGSTYTNAGATIAWAESPDSVTFTPVSGATGITYTPASPITAATYYQATVTAAGVTCTPSAAPKVSITPALAITTQPTAQTACVGSGFTLSVAANNATSYQWYRRGTAISGATSATYTVATAALTDTGNYYVAVNGLAPCAAINSSTVRVNVNRQVAITTQPFNRTLCAGNTLTLTVAASNGTGYQWYQNGSAITGATSATYTVASASLTDTGSYYVAVLGNAPCADLNSNAVAVIVNPAQTITTQPVATTVCSGTALTLSVVANNASTYQWFRNGTSISGATSATYTVASAAAGNAGNYYVAIGGTAPCTSLNSSTVAVTVNPAVAITVQPTPRTICQGQTLTLSVTASNAASYQWYQSGNAITGATSATYTVAASALTDSGSYYVAISGTAPCATMNSNAVAVIVNPGVAITTQPTAQTVCSGTGITLTVAASNATGYQWYKGGSAISGATSATYTVASAAVADAGNYYVIVSGTAPCATATSSTVAVTVNPAVVINTQPIARTVCTGSALNLSVSASNTTGYQWYQSGNAISGATSATYTVASTTAADSGNYYVMISGTSPCSPVNSSTVAVTITPIAAITASATQATVCRGLADTLTVTSSGMNYTYSWNTTPVQTGATAYVNPTAQTTYTVTGTDGVTGCITTGSVTVNVEQPATVSFSPSTASIGCGGTPVQLTATINTTGTITKTVWKPVGYATGNPLVGLYTDATATTAYDSSTSQTATSVYAKNPSDIAYNLSVTTAICPAITSSNSASLTVTAASGNGLAAGSAAANTTYYSQSGSDTVQNKNCETIASVAPSGASPISGLVMTTVYSSTVGAPAPVIASGRPYVPRYYQITPQQNASTATGTITLFATNGEFKAYNVAAQDSNNRIVAPDSVAYNNLKLYLLPDIDSPATVTQRSSTVLISKESGTSTLGTPGTFTPGVKKAIRPSSVVWNSTDNRWEVTLSTVGFSGFFIGGGGSGAGPLPVTFTGIAASGEKGRNRVEWNVGSENNVARYEVEKLSGKTFERIGTIPAAGMAQYVYYDAAPSKGLNTYRVKAVDVDGAYSYSPSATVRVANAGGFVLDLYPNPTTDKVTVKGTGSTSTEATVTVSELSGRLLLTQTVKAAEGQVDMSALPSGTYMLQWSDGVNKESVRVTKQ